MITLGIVPDGNAVQGKGDASNTPFHRHYNMINDTEKLSRNIEL